MRILGVDPGITGALVLMDQSWRVLSALRMPTLKAGKGSEVNCAAVAAWIEANRPIDHAYVELVHSMPGQGVTSTFTFGLATGAIVGVLSGLKVPITRVPPQTWKKRCGLIGKDKDCARGRAIQLWPEWRELDGKTAGQAFADAALIARYGHGEELAGSIFD